MNLKDLAASLGLSQTTVSRALNGYPEVSEATRKRVAEAALRHGYRPDSRARSLATGKAMAVGLVLPMTARQEIVNPIFADFVAGAAETLASRGYDIVMSLAGEEEQTQIYRSMLSKGRVDGMIMQAPLTGDRRIGLLKQLGMPFVVHGRVSDHDDEYCWMDIDNRHAFHTATDHLLDLGHRRIALLNGIEAMDFAHRRRDGFLEALAERGLTADTALMASEAMTEHYGHREAARMLRLPDPPTAFLTSSLLVAMGAQRAIASRGLRMGLDVSVVTHDDGLSYLPNGEPDAPIFTATRSPVHDAGHICAEMLLRLIDAPQTAPFHTKLEACLVLGPSSGPAPNL
ncbi:LacI family DNA-binding transcriptional regulator [Tropicimonas sp. IMCC6043]|uniref:LacI family DNA-binding transcriptional regulator n=1 Tax=Tropicimonas sp. IMCC6043 TaxID=2510645 RepID=UPI00101CF0E5|nr:substrate-binding domain-containing protein [Tropicimonas sp. IMCC6043]RYH09732.1 LacI family DNA-binding transcriptional regulator [Tropicimonas sp. IMCC6043]